MAGLLKSLVSASEKAAHIARLCRHEDALFHLLVAEKTGADKNQRFVQDFKTLADVLIQEVIKHNVGREFPELRDHIGGEESNEFSNGLGETVVVRVCTTQRDTAALLCRVLENNQAAAELLAAAVHQDVVLSDPELDAVALSVPAGELAIWIDPIDSTNEYIRGHEDVAPEDGIYPSGLRSALVLVGAYERCSGCPVLGVINEPFFRRDPLSQRWHGRYHLLYNRPAEGAAGAQRWANRGGLVAYVHPQHLEAVLAALATVPGL
ncbi:inositol polyphosphate 1-phosphatase [Nothoprocta perdicaria]|uniref:inositol polyphosphate 1-phosphatase n=1 Tax=Nothoprocta perdicaria TaxID=30464 RepID=UPI000E1BAE9D|nr:inositol polyphosphate 1-phosphatase [Nothoprocta perdicaria]